MARGMLNNKVSSSETPKLRSQNEPLFGSIKDKLPKREECDLGHNPPHERNFSTDYDTKMLKKPPSHGSTGKQVKPLSLHK